MLAGRHDISVEQGSTFNLYFVVDVDKNAWDFTGYVSRMMVRQSSYDTAVLDIPETDGSIVLGSDGSVNITVDAATMAGIPEGTYVYDIEVENEANEVWKLLKGRFTVFGEVSK